MFITSSSFDHVYVFTAPINEMTREDIYGYLAEFVIIVAGVLIAELLYAAIHP